MREPSPTYRIAKNKLTNESCSFSHLPDLNKYEQERIELKK
jgi:hypothetical protein